jgi:hypothetical protein
MLRFLSPGVVTRLAVIAVIALAVPGCGNPKINKANFEKVTVGMTLKEVEDILGPGAKQSQGDGSNVGGQFGIDPTMGGTPSTRQGDMYVWESGAKKITIYMDLAGKVATKQASGL